jgi:polyhydroxyalkanoate synthase
MSKTPDSGKAEDDEPSTVEQYLVKDPERFALNMARMIEQAGKAASAWAEPREKGEVRDHVAEPVVDMVKTFSKLSEYWLADPQRALEAQTRAVLRLHDGLGQRHSAHQQRRARHRRRVKPERGDKRFLDPEWGRNAFFDFLKQAYLVTSRWAAELVEHAEGLDEHTRHKAAFTSSRCPTPSRRRISS